VQIRRPIPSTGNLRYACLLITLPLFHPCSITDFGSYSTADDNPEPSRQGKDNQVVGDDTASGRADVNKLTRL
jgi:hypothetical protein